MRRPIGSLRAASVVLVALVLGCHGCRSGERGRDSECPEVKPTKALAPGLSGHIAVLSTTNGGQLCQFVFVMAANGSGARPITPPVIAHFYAELSPDGLQVAFLGSCVPRTEDLVASLVGHLDLCVINVDGSGLRTVLQEPGISDMAWSPDGKRFAFGRRVGEGKTEIHTVAVDGGDERPVTNDGASSTQPTWSPDGKWLAYVSNKDGPYQIYRISVNGGVPMLLTGGSRINMGPAWSHDGKHIAFYSNRSGKPDSPLLTEMRKGPGNGNLPLDGAPDIYVMEVDGSNVVRLTNGASANRGPSWSPDDRRLVFTTDRDKRYEAYVMAADGTEQRRVSNLPRGSEFASWSV